MCSPTAAAIAISSISTAGTVYTQRRNASRQERAYREAADQRQEQLDDQTSVALNERARQARRERARLRAMSAESGVSGLSITEALRNIDFQAGTDNALTRLDGRNRSDANAAQAQSLLYGIEQPDYLGSTLNAVGTGLQIYRDKPDG